MLTRIRKLREYHNDYDYDHCREEDEKINDCRDLSRRSSSYFFLGRKSNDFLDDPSDLPRENLYSDNRFSQRKLSNEPKGKSWHELDSSTIMSNENDKEYETDDFDEAYEISEAHLTYPRISRAIGRSYSDHNYEIRGDKDVKYSPKQPGPKRIVCKFCTSSKQPGSCPCPIHLPTVQSRYLRQIHDSTRNAITINVFRNGDYRITPTMVHIPKFHMRSMEDIMKIVDKSVRFPVGYAYALYTLLGDIVEDPKDLQPYEMYVVVNNCKREFIQMEYGSSKRLSTDMSRRRRNQPQSTFAFQANFNSRA